MDENPFVDELVERSWSGIEWLKKRADANLDFKTILGGHTYPRTYRPRNGMVGVELVI